MKYRPPQIDGPRVVLVAGLPRAGTTWVGEALGQAAPYIHEPDNEKIRPLALRAKRSTGRFPVLEAGDKAPPDYERLWAQALSPDRRRPAAGDVLARLLLRSASTGQIERAVECGVPGTTPRLRLAAALAPASTRGRDGRSDKPGVPVVVKSVHIPLALSWIADRWQPRIVVVLRHPLNVVASMRDLGMPDQDRKLDGHPLVLERYVEPWGLPVPVPGASTLTRASWQVGLLTAALQDTAKRTSGCVVVTHESLCQSPEHGFRRLFDSCGLAWSEQVGAFLDRSNRPGAGYTTHRVATGQAQRWRDRLSHSEITEIHSVLRSFPLQWEPGWDTFPGTGAD